MYTALDFTTRPWYILPTILVFVWETHGKYLAYINGILLKLKKFPRSTPKIRKLSLHSVCVDPFILQCCLGFLTKMVEREETSKSISYPEIGSSPFVMNQTFYIEQFWMTSQWRMKVRTCFRTLVMIPEMEVAGSGARLVGSIGTPKPRQILYIQMIMIRIQNHIIKIIYQEHIIFCI